MSAFAETYRAIDFTIRKFNKFLIGSHMRPDGDAIGSQLALGFLLQSMGKQVTIWNQDRVPGKYLFLPHVDWVKQPPAQPEAFEVMFALDNAAYPRLGKINAAVASRKYLVNIDHHASNDGYGDLTLIDPDSPATGQVLYELFRAMQYPITKDMATCLYAAISTDTGSFQYPNTTSRCMRVCAELIDLGVDVADVCRKIYESFPIGRLLLLKKILENLKISYGGKVGTYWITKEMYTDTGAKPEDNEGLIDHIRSVDRIVVAAMFEEAEEGKIRLSIRSKHPLVDVNQIAMHFGGGGHAEAAGARIPGTREQVEQAVLKKIGDVLAEAGI